ncbi:hypothetical protein [Streptomyces cucumeris]|uniref:hypothetical protein n=1 Tax=Streptomyces cucumeris TaxID=2962890 RepID=UPI003D746806
MSPDLIAIAVLLAPGGLLGPVCLAGHRRARTRDQAEAAVCAAFRPTGAPAPEPPPKGRVKATPQHPHERLATVIGFPSHRRNAA